MYCIDCGTQNPDHTRYCNRCGVNLETVRRAATGHLTAPPPASPLTAKHVNMILLMSTFLGLGSLLILLGCLIAVASASPSERDDISPVAVFIGTLGILGIGFIIWRLLKMIPTAALSVPAEEPRPLPQRQFAAPPVRQELPSARPDGAPSVVEHTTHHLSQYAPPGDPERP
jgi:hypothetical protein